MVSNDWIERSPYDLGAVHRAMQARKEIKHYTTLLAENTRLREQVATLKQAIHDACRELQEQAGDN